MPLPNNIPDLESFKKCVVVRWKDIENVNSGSQETIIEVLASNIGHQLPELKTLYSGETESGKFAFLLLKTVKEAKEFCLDAKQCAKFSINLVIDLNGMHIQDANDIFKTISLSKEVTDDDLIELLVNLICLEVPEKESLAKEELRIIRNGIEKVIQNGNCTNFGSYSSSVRRNGYSDIDLAVSCEETDSGPVRPLQMIIDNPKCLLEKPLTNSEFLFYPQEEIIKAIYHCLHDHELFKDKFEVRTLLVRTPIVIFKSTMIPNMKMSYDVSVNNQISVEKSSILSDFISRDESVGNKMRNIVMFMIHWMKTNKLMGGVYSDEKLERKLKFNSYIINQMIIHLTQATAKKCLVNISEKPEKRVTSYNFDDLYNGYRGFLKSFFTYYLNFNYENNGIFGIDVIEKPKLAEMQRTTVSPLMIIDPLDVTHNISENVFPEGLEIFKSVMKNSLKKMNNSCFRITDLL